MAINTKVLLVSLILLVNQLCVCLFIIWYSQNMYITRDQQNSYLKYLYSTDPNFENLKNTLEKMKIINKTAYENILRLVLKLNAKEVQLLLSLGEGVEFMPDKEQQMMLKIIMSRLKHFPGANVTVNDENINITDSTKSSFVREIVLSSSPKSTIMNALRKTGKEKSESNKPLLEKTKDRTSENSSLPDEPKTQAPSAEKATHKTTEKNNPPEEPKARTPSLEEVADTKAENDKPLLEKPKGTPSPEKVKHTKPEKNNQSNKTYEGTSSPAKENDKKSGNNNPHVGTPSPAQVKVEKKEVLKITKTIGPQPCETVLSLFNGRENTSYEEYSMTTLESRFSKDTLQGGRWSPKDCKPQQRIAIIVPYRDRDRHFKLLLNNLIPKLRRQMVDYTFYVVEQASAGTRFNRGMIRNIGFLEAKKEAKYDCYIFNDVDTIIENDLNFYTCAPNSAYHIAVRIDRHKYRLLYKNLIGGIVSFTEDFFLKTNGYSNFFFIWGGEDDVMYKRVMAAGGTVVRPDFNVSHTTTAKHDRDPVFNERYLLLRENSRFWEKDGLNTLEYQKLVTEKRKLYTWIYVNVNETKYSEMMKIYNAEWNRLHQSTTSPIPTQTMEKTSTEDTK